MNENERQVYAVTERAKAPRAGSSDNLDTGWKRALRALPGALLYVISWQSIIECRRRDMAAKFQGPGKLSVGTMGAIAALVAGVAAADDVGPQLKDREIKATFVDAQVHGVSPDGAKWSAIYKADGAAEYNGGKTGKWRIKGDQFCNRVSGYDEACVAVFKLGNHQYQFMRADGKKGSVVTNE